MSISSTMAIRIIPSCCQGDTDGINEVIAAKWTQLSVWSARWADRRYIAQELSNFTKKAPSCPARTKQSGHGIRWLFHFPSCCSRSYAALRTTVDGLSSTPSALEPSPLSLLFSNAVVVLWNARSVSEWTSLFLHGTCSSLRDRQGWRCTVSFSIQRGFTITHILELFRLGTNHYKNQPNWRAWLSCTARSQTLSGEVTSGIQTCSGQKGDQIGGKNRHRSQMMIVAVSDNQVGCIFADMSGFDNMLHGTKGLQKIVEAFCVRLALLVPINVKIAHHHQVLFSLHALQETEKTPQRT